MQSSARTVDEYLDELPTDRREAISAVRDMILKNLDKDYEEGMSYGMIGYYVPHRIFPNGYHCNPKQPLPFACLASQKNYMSLHIMSLYTDGDEESWFRRQWEKTGKKLDMGKCCIRFRKLDDLAFEVIGEVIRKSPAAKYIQYYQNALKTRLRGSTGKAEKKKARPEKSSGKSKSGTSSKPTQKPLTKKTSTPKAKKKN